MAVQETMWGPSLHVYSRNFVPPLAGAHATGPGEFWERNKLMPTRILEDTLCEQNMLNKPGYGDKFVHSLILNLSGYLNLSNRPIFSHYYGFLCVRHIIGAVCAGVLIETRSMDSFMAKLHPDINWQDFSLAIASEALNMIAEQVDESLDYSEQVLSICDRLRASGGFPRTDGLRFLSMLWKDRGSFFRICKLGLLPGCTVLLIVLFQAVISSGELVADNEEPEWLRDLIFRQYLVASNEDRLALWHPCIFTSIQHCQYAKRTYGPVDREDSLELSRAYIHLVSMSRLSSSDSKSLTLDMMESVHAFVIAMLRKDPSTSSEILRIVTRGLNFLWMVIDDRGHMTVSDHNKVQLFAMSNFLSIANFQRDFVLNHHQQYGFAKMLRDSDIVELAGRVMLPVSNNDNAFELGEAWEGLLESLPGLHQTIRKCTSVAPELFLESIHLWAKVNTQIELDYSISSHIATRSSKSARHMGNVHKAWLQLGKALVRDKAALPQSCAYPRCFRPTCTVSFGAPFVCGSCVSNFYCDLRCHVAHWELATCESHKLNCFASDD